MTVDRIVKRLSSLGCPWAAIKASGSRCRGELKRQELCDRKNGECPNWTGSPRRYASSCQPAACADLETRVKALNGSHDQWGLFAIDFVGRRLIGREQSRWLGDPPKKVIVERDESLALLETQWGRVWGAPR